MQTNDEVYMQHKLTIRPVEATDEAIWTAIWQSYNTFYNVSLPAQVTATTWARILDPTSPINALLAIDSVGEPLGFANYILHAYTWSDLPACLLDDLFVRPEARGRGVGHALIEQLISLARSSNWGRLYWMTREDNTTARRLYDRFCTSDGFVRYAISFDEFA
ncbi:MAG: GNAT family N-acetyltransferase [Ktedonobacteraceae bacterium]